MEGARSDLSANPTSTLHRSQDSKRAEHSISKAVEPKSIHSQVKHDLRQIWTAPDRTTADKAINVFAEKYGPKYDKAVQCLVKDRDRLLAFFDFPAEHWDHIRTTNPIESIFATVRHRTVRTKGALSQTTAKLMVFKLIMTAAKT